MKWSWKIGEFAGIGVYIHATFVLIIAWAVLISWGPQASLGHVAATVLLVLAMFACVLLHEFGHALTARRYGIRTRHITLYPIGGVARLERMPDEPLQELWVALAGPAVNLVIAGVLFGWLLLSATLAPVEGLSISEGSLIERLMMINVVLALFNLIPAFPMDGGRVLRALLAMRMDYSRATQIAAHVGQGLALVFGFWGMFANPFLVFVALFIWMGAGQEANMAQIKYALHGIPVRDAMLTDFKTLSADDTLARAAELILAGSQHDFPVLEGGRVAGVLTRGDLMSGLARDGKHTRVHEIMHRDFETVDALDMLESAVLKLQTCDCRILPVLRGGELIGLLTLDNVGEFVMIHRALAPTRTRP